MAEYKTQHYVPQGYQAAWTDPETPARQEPYVWVFPKGGGTPKRKAPQNLFAETDLYTRPTSDGSRDVGIEKKLGVLDSDFTSLRREVLDVRGVITDEVRYKLSLFAAALSARVVKQRDHHREQWQRVADMADLVTTDAIEAIDRGEYSPGPFSDWTADDFARAGMNRVENDPEAMRAMIAQPMPVILNGSINGLMPFLLDMPLTILCTEHDVGFVSSDAPCVLYDPMHRRFMGMASPTVEVSLPLSPQQAAVWTYVPSATYQEAPHAMARAVNWRTRTRAYHAFFARRQTLDPAWVGLPDV